MKRHVASSKAQKVNFKRRSRLLASLVVAIVSGLVGSYLVIRSHAASVPDNTVVLTDSNNDAPNGHSGYKVNPEDGQIHVFIEVPNPSGGASQMHFSLFMIAHLQATNFTCVSGYTCKFKTGGYTGIPSVYDYDSSINTSEINFCVPLKPGDTGRGFTIGTLNFNPATAIHQDYSKDWRQDFYEVHSFASGPCPNLPADKWFGDTNVEIASGNTLYGSGAIKADWGERGDDGTCTGTCGGVQNPGGDGPGGDGKGDGDQGKGTGTKGTGTGKTGTGTGGGSSGSTATKQGDKPNSTPSSSNQGSKNQTKLYPSPFYDGKQYNRESESDSGFGGLFKKSGSGGIAKGWYLLIALLLLATGGGIWWWKTRHLTLAKRSKD